MEEYLGFSGASYKLNALNSYSKSKGTQLYLIIDEYDNFTNNILSEEGEAVYHALTHAQGFYRDFFKLFKGMFQRIMMMGVSPVTGERASTVAITSAPISPWIPCSI